MKKLINDPKTLVAEMLEGAVRQAPGQVLLAGENVVLRRDVTPPNIRRVAVLSGGGSGHEPAHASYVGEGMLTAAVAGDVFTSPSSDAVLAGLRAVTGEAGALLIVKNYTGDRLNFGLAAEILRGEGKPVEIVVVADDVALRDTVPKARRRGIAGTILVHKIAGAAAERGDDLAEVARLTSAAAADLGSMGLALEPCIVPAAGKAGFTLGESEIELGLGIHGEPGVRRAPMQPAAALVGILLSAIADDLALKRGERCVLLVNGLGGTPPMELDVVAREALAQAGSRGLVIERAWTGTLLSALDMRGCSLSLLRVDDERLALLDAPTGAPAWPSGGSLNQDIYLPAAEAPTKREQDAPVPADMEAMRRITLAVMSAMSAAEAELTDLDARAGDGDLGASLARGAEAVRALPTGAWIDPPTALRSMAEALRRAIGGSSGPFYATGLMRAARELSTGASDAPAIATAFEAACDAIAELGGAQEGDRTMLDALRPAARALSTSLAAGESLPTAFAKAEEAARKGAEVSAQMLPRLGRASYLGERALGIPDAGAIAVSIWLRAIAEASRG